LRYILRASEFFKPNYGSLSGKCVICGFKTDKGHPVEFSDNFTAWNLLHEGNCICEFCYELVKNQDYRRKSWIATVEGVKFLKKDEILPTLLDPPIPFAIYITRTGKKQGFLQVISKVNYSKERFFIAFDDELIYVERDQLNEMVDLAKRARKLGFTKSDLREPSVKRWKYRDVCEAISDFSKNPLWEVVVYAVD